MSFEAQAKSKIDSAIRLTAIFSHERQDYLPLTPEEGRTFEAHQWVKDAVTLAYMAGMRDGADAPQFAPDVLAIAGASVSVALSESVYTSLFG